MNWSAVVRELGPKLFRYFSATQNAEMAEDLTQEVLLRLVRKVEGGDFDPARGSITMYAYGIANLVKLEGLRDQRRVFLQIEDAPELQFDARLEESQDVLRLRRAIARLSPSQQDVLALYLDRDLTLEEIAELLMTPLNSVKSHLHRAKIELKQMMSASQQERL